MRYALNIAVYATVLGSFLLIAEYIKQDPTPGVYATKILVGRNKTVHKALFSPDNNPTDLLIDLIDAEKKQILVAIFTLTDKNIAQALIDARKRGVRIEIVADPGYLRPETYSKIDFLAESGINIFTFNTFPCKPKGYCLMHNKFAIFSKNILGKALLWTGSFNWTRSANTSNQENIIVLDDIEIIEAFTKQFEVLKKRSKIISSKPYHQNNTEPQDGCEAEQNSPAQESWWHAFINRLL